MKQEKLIKPAQFAEQQLINAIVDEKWKTGDALPPERELAQILGITRPTLREALQRLARDGWITIVHGKPSIVNDYKNNGGLGILKSLINVSKKVPDTLINDWLEFRIIIFPALAEKAIINSKEKILSALDKLPDLNTPANEFALFDWNLQMLIIRLSKNSVAQMLYNDLADIYSNESTKYFENETTKKASIFYYKELKKAIIDNQNIQNVVQIAMNESLKFWNSNKL
jgi:GntR family negative regulator for fad regulon and positive regulator of fabA